MPSSLAGFDWWILVVVPALVAIATYYFQKFLDWGAISGFRFLRRMRLREQVALNKRVYTLLAEGTYQTRYQYLIGKALMRGVLVLVWTMCINAYYITKPPSCFPLVGNKPIELLAAAAFSSLAFYHFGLSIGLLRDYYRAAMNPMSAAKSLYKRSRQLGVPELEEDIRTITRMALRWQHVRDGRLAQAQATLNEEEAVRYQEAIRTIREG